MQLYISIAGLSFFYLSNSATLSFIFGRDLLNKQAKDERLDHMVGAGAGGADGEVVGGVRPGEGAAGPVPAHSGAE